MRITYALTAALTASLAVTVPTAAAQTKPQETACQTDPHFRDFDFWLGKWDVTSRKSGKAAGTNVIKAIEGGCAVLENWHGKRGSTGKSVNYYNPITKKWRQVWVAAGAYSLDIEGGLNDQGSMVMSGTIWYYKNGASAPFRGTWTPNEDGSVRQFFEQYDADKKEWKPWFDGLYKKPGKQ